MSGTESKPVKAVQNFTAYVVGKADTIALEERYCIVAAWHSVVSLVDRNWPDKAQMPKWDRTQDGANRSGMGWVDTSKSPRI